MARNPKAADDAPAVAPAPPANAAKQAREDRKGSTHRDSLRDLDPLEEGGRTARDGFDYQDHIAVNKCLDMLSTAGPCEVWCEAEDDIVLVWNVDGVEEFEFVQVKGDDRKQAWSVARLCAGEVGTNGKPKRSIVEKSLAHDRGKESCSYRIITRWRPDAALDVLTLPRSRRAELAIVTRVSEAATLLTNALGAIRSPNGNSLAHWAALTTWEHRSDQADVRNDSLLKLDRVLAAAGESLAPDQREELHAALYAKVQEASSASGVTQKHEKRIRRDELRIWLFERAKKIQHPTPPGGTGPLVAKLTEATVDLASIELAQDFRRRYVAEARVPKYLAVDDREHLEGEVLAALHGLKVRLDAGQLPDDGREFLSRCLTELKRVRDGLPGVRPPENLVYGYMYDVMNRCLHRLVRVQP